MAKRFALSRWIRRPLARLLLGVTGLSSLGCGAEFDPPTEVKSLRILGVSKDRSYALPGDQVNLTMAWHDGSPKLASDPTRRISIAWLAGCVNPPGDLYATCFSDGSNVIVPGFGPDFRVTIPPDIISSRPPPQDPKQQPYGLSYVFFAACAGTLDLNGGPEFPMRCLDAAGKTLGSDDFVAGYTAIYVFSPKADGEPFLNQNPDVTGFVSQNEDVTDVACLGDTCRGACDETGCENRAPDEVDCGPDAPHTKLCIPACKDDGDPVECTGYHVRPVIDPSSAEYDEVSNASYGNAYTEQMWISYYSTKGGLKSATKLLNDATSGWNADFGTDFYPPKTPGPVQIWAVVHDNRGGVSWSGITVQVQ